jgi:ribose transport system permease protein
MNASTETPGEMDGVDDILTQAINEEGRMVVGTSNAAFWQRLIVSRDAALTAVGIAVFIFFAVTVPATFLTSTNLLNMLRNVSLIGIVAAGVAYLMIAGEIDLSVGSQLGFLVVVLGVLVARQGIDIWVASGIVLALGALVGLVNGLLVTKLGIPSFIVTLAMLTGYRSGALVVSQQTPSSGSGVGLFFEITGKYVGSTTVPWVIVWMLVVMLIAGIALVRTKYGYHVYATGGNADAARDSGVRTGRVKLWAFVLTSFLCGLAALLLFGSLRVAEPTAGTGFEFRVIGAVIVGGVALTGGRGSIYGVLIGTVIIGMITSGLTLLGLSQHLADVVTGGLIVAVGTMDLLVRRAASRRLGFLEA